LLFGNTGELVWGYSSQINIFPPLCCILDTPNKKKHTHTICDHLWAQWSSYFYMSIHIYFKICI
jgi:hypothetical protein